MCCIMAFPIVQQHSIINTTSTMMDTPNTPDNHVNTMCSSASAEGSIRGRVALPIAYNIINAMLMLIIPIAVFIIIICIIIF